MTATTHRPNLRELLVDLFERYGTAEITERIDRIAEGLDFLSESDMREVLEEAWELVDHGLLSAADFRAFIFENPVSLWAGSNPDFFKGTVVEDAVAKRLAS